MKETILVIGFVLSASTVVLRAAMPEEVQAALKSREPEALSAVRDSLDAYLDNPEPDVREAAVAISLRAGLEDSHVTLILNHYATEGNPRVRASMIRALSPYVTQDKAVSTAIASALSPRYDVDDAVVIDLGRSIKIDGLQPRLLGVLEGGSTSMRLAALNTLVEKYTVPVAYAELLEDIKTQAAQETAGAKRLVTGMTSDQQTQFLASLPSTRLHDLIEAVHYVEAESSPAELNKTRQADQQVSDPAPAERKGEASEDSSDAKIETPGTNSERLPVIRRFIFPAIVVILVVLAGIWFFKRRQ